MSHGFQIDASKATLEGKPLHPLKEDETLVVEGRLGNPVWVNDDDAFSKKPKDTTGGTFYILVAANKGHTASQVADLVQKEHRLSIAPVDSPSSSFELIADSGKSRRYLDQDLRKELRFRPDLKHLRAFYGEKADFFMVACHLPNKREEIFGQAFRQVKDEWGRPTGNINTRKYNLVQKSADGVVEAIHWGGFAIYDRQDLNGLPDDLKVAVLSDIHIAARNDALELAIILKFKDKSLYLKFNNANANLTEAIIPWINDQYRQGKLDMVFIAGDNVDFDGIKHETARRLKDSNYYYFAKFLKDLLPPVFVVKGNHDVVPEEFSAQITAANLNLSSEEVGQLESDRYAGIFYFLRDAIRSITEDSSTAMSFYGVVNPFQDIIISLGRGEPANPSSKEAKIIMMDMGGDDLAHFRQDDPVYRDLQMWPWGLPYLHSRTIWQSITRGSPDLRGSTPEQLAWFASNALAGDGPKMVIAHPPLLNNKHVQVPYNPDPSKRLRPMTPVGSQEDLTFNTMAHGADLFTLIARDPTIRLYMGGHAHFSGNAYVIGTDYQNNNLLYRGPVREALNQIDSSDSQAIHDFWYPKDPCRKSTQSIECQVFGEAVDGTSNVKYTWQIGSAGVGRRPVPVFTVMTINPEGLVSQAQDYYVNKELIEDRDLPSQYTARPIVSKIPLPNDRLIDEWERLQTINPNRSIAWSKVLGDLLSRLNQVDTNFIPWPGLLDNYPRYIETVTHPFISPTKLIPSLRLHLNFGEGALGVSATYLFSQDQIGGIQRALLLEGAIFGWLTNDDNHYIYWGIQTPSVIDFQMFRHVLIRGLNFQLGPGISFEKGTENVAPYFHNDLEMIQFVYHRNSFDFSAGLKRRNIFYKPGEWLGFAGATFTFD